MTMTVILGCSDWAEVLGDDTPMCCTSCHEDDGLFAGDYLLCESEPPAKPGKPRRESRVLSIVCCALHVEKLSRSQWAAAVRAHRKAI